MNRWRWNFKNLSWFLPAIVVWRITSSPKRQSRIHVYQESKFDFRVMPSLWFTLQTEWVLNLFNWKRITRDYAGSLVSRLCCISGMEVYWIFFTFSIWSNKALKESFSDRTLAKGDNVVRFFVESFQYVFKQVYWTLMNCWFRMQLQNRELFNLVVHNSNKKKSHLSLFIDILRLPEKVKKVRLSTTVIQLKGF